MNVFRGLGSNLNSENRSNFTPPCEDVTSGDIKLHMVELTEPPSVSVRGKKSGKHDQVYHKYNAKYYAERNALIDFSNKWVKLLADSETLLPEKAIDDIRSCIGQAKLLIDSKLPQFRSLLDCYLNEDAKPHYVLACDLEGWWDVACITIEKVKAKFQKLEKWVAH